MTDPGPYATRREVDLLKAGADREHAEIRAAIRDLAAGESRGVVGLQVQMQDMTREQAKLQAAVEKLDERLNGTMGALRADMDGRFDSHAQVHRDEVRARAAARWRLAGLGIAALAAIEGPLIYVMTHLH